MNTQTRSTKCQYRPAISTPWAGVRPIAVRMAVTIRITSPEKTCEPWNPVRTKKAWPNCGGPQGFVWSRAPSWMSSVYS